MTKRCKNYIIWFTIGMAVQLVMHILADTNYMRHPILFCIASGFLILVAIGAGMVVASRDKKQSLSYAEYAELEDLHKEDL